MTQKFNISAKKREVSKTLRNQLKREGKVLGVVYGHGVAPVAIYFEPSEILRVYRKAGYSALVDLDVEGKKMKVVLKSISLDPVKNTISHVDVVVVNLKEKIVVQVPVEFTGESSAVKNFGGVFTVNHHLLDIRCLPTDIPEKFVVDISTLHDIHDHISVKDIPMDADKLEVLHLEPGVVLCMIAGKGGTSSAEETEDVAVAGEGEAEKSAE